MGKQQLSCPFCVHYHLDILNTDRIPIDGVVPVKEEVAGVERFEIIHHCLVQGSSGHYEESLNSAHVRRVSVSVDK